MEGEVTSRNNVCGGGGFQERKRNNEGGGVPDMQEEQGESGLVHKGNYDFCHLYLTYILSSVCGFKISRSINFTEKHWELPIEK